jgi:preprotein translocase SecE subunit
MADSSAPEQGPIGQGVTFVKECRAELDKVTRPTRQETTQATLVTLFIVVFVAGALALMDVLFNSVMAAVL